MSMIAAERAAQQQIGRPAPIANFRKPVLEILQQTPNLASLEILRRVCLSFVPIED
jgi:hypothetical protein